MKYFTEFEKRSLELQQHQLDALVEIIDLLIYFKSLTKDVAEDKAKAEAKARAEARTRTRAKAETRAAAEAKTEAGAESKARDEAEAETGE